MEGTIESPHKQFDWIQIAMFGLFILFVALGFIFFVIYRTQNPVANNTVVSHQNSDHMAKTSPTRGKVSLLRSSITQIKVGDTVTVSVLGNSDGESIVGYDLLLSYDPNALQLIQTASASDSFSASAYTRNSGFISITGTKLAKASPLILNATVLETVTFKAKIAGQTSVKVVPVTDREQTKFVTTKLEHVVPAEDSLSLQIF